MIWLYLQHRVFWVVALEWACRLLELTKLLLIPHTTFTLPQVLLHRQPLPSIKVTKCDINSSSYTTTFLILLSWPLYIALGGLSFGFPLWIPPLTYAHVILIQKPALSKYKIKSYRLTYYVTLNKELKLLALKYWACFLIVFWTWRFCVVVSIFCF